MVGKSTWPNACRATTRATWPSRSGPAAFGSTRSSRAWICQGTCRICCRACGCGERWVADSRHRSSSICCYTSREQPRPTQTTKTTPNWQVTHMMSSSFWRNALFFYYYRYNWLLKCNVHEIRLMRRVVCYTDTISINTKTITNVDFTRCFFNIHFDKTASWVDTIWLFRLTNRLEWSKHLYYSFSSDSTF